MHYKWQQSHCQMRPANIDAHRTWHAVINIDYCCDVAVDTGRKVGKCSVFSESLLNHFKRIREGEKIKYFKYAIDCLDT